MSLQMDWQVSSLMARSFFVSAVLRLMLASRRLRSASPGWTMDMIRGNTEWHNCTHQGAAGLCWWRVARCMSSGGQSMPQWSISAPVCRPRISSTSDLKGVDARALRRSTLACPFSSDGLGIGRTLSTTSISLHRDPHIASCITRSTTNKD